MAASKAEQISEAIYQLLRTPRIPGVSSESRSRREGVREDEGLVLIVRPSLNVSRMILRPPKLVHTLSVEVVGLTQDRNGVTLIDAVMVEAHARIMDPANINLGGLAQDIEPQTMIYREDKGDWTELIHRYDVTYRTEKGSLT